MRYNFQFYILTGALESVDTAIQEVTSNVLLNEREIDFYVEKRLLTKLENRSRDFAWLSLNICSCAVNGDFAAYLKHKAFWDRN